MRRGRFVRWKERGRHLLRSYLASSLARRLVVLNLGGLCALLLGLLYMNQFRASLIDARVQSLQTQGEIIAAAIAAAATFETDAIVIEPENLLKLAPGESYSYQKHNKIRDDFSINPEKIGPVLQRLITPTRTRARVYDRDGNLILDTNSLVVYSNIFRFNLPPLETHKSFYDKIKEEWIAIYVRGRMWLNGFRLPLYQEDAGTNGRFYPDVSHALAGKVQSMVWITEKGETLISVAIPIFRFRVLRAVLLLTTKGGDIDNILASERYEILRIFLMSAGVVFLLSLFFAGTIVEPIRRLSKVAEHIRTRTELRVKIPDLTHRMDEIGHLSQALREMTETLYQRIDAIKNFAADVAHELKNPLTSLRCAIETLPHTRSEENQQRLLEVMQHDVLRLDRLLTDISQASRLDAELVRTQAEPIDLRGLIQSILLHLPFQDPRIIWETSVSPPALVLGQSSRLEQVFTNLIENAKSFSPLHACIHISLHPASSGHDPSRNGYEVTIEDEGPGIPPHALTRIFERFYKDRPGQDFGEHSGLGLSISRQIIEAYGGRIWAENRQTEADMLSHGARFHLWFPAYHAN